MVDSEFFLELGGLVALFQALCCAAAFWQWEFPLFLCFGLCFYLVRVRRDSFAAMCAKGLCRASLAGSALMRYTCFVRATYACLWHAGLPFPGFLGRVRCVATVAIEFERPGMRAAGILGLLCQGLFGKIGYVRDLLCETCPSGGEAIIETQRKLGVSIMLETCPGFLGDHRELYELLRLVNSLFVCRVEDNHNV